GTHPSRAGERATRADRRARRRGPDPRRRRGPPPSLSPMSETFALYVHVPWCRHVCPYCDFNVYADARPPEREYTDALLRELDAWAATAPFAGRRAGSVYVGGGTPSLFTPDAIARLVDGVARRVGLDPGAEVTLEANPGTVTTATLRAHRAAGVN